MRAGKIDASTVVEAGAAATGMTGARMFLVAGAPVSVGDLLRGMVVVSGNDAAAALAEAVAGSQAAFVEMMNRQAQRKGLAQPRFVNFTGEPQPDHRPSARDLPTLAPALTRDFPNHYALYGL